MSDSLHLQIRPCGNSADPYKAHDPAETPEIAGMLGRVPTRPARGIASTLRLTPLASSWS